MPPPPGDLAVVQIRDELHRPAELERAAQQVESLLWLRRSRSHKDRSRAHLCNYLLVRERSHVGVRPSVNGELLAFDSS